MVGNPVRLFMETVHWRSRRGMKMGMKIYKIL